MDEHAAMAICLLWTNMQPWLYVCYGWACSHGYMSVMDEHAAIAWSQMNCLLVGLEPYIQLSNKMPMG